MDTLKEYIEMCRKAQKDIDPKLKDINEGDTIFYNGQWGMYFKEQFWLEGTYSNGDLIIWGREIFKLYHQDQLQGMFTEKDPLKLTKEFLSSISQTKRYPHPSGKSGYALQELTTHEQLWLAFVMKEKFNKIWNNKDWVKK